MTASIMYVQGDPATVSATAGSLAETAEVLLAAAADLLHLSDRDETISVAVDAVRTLAAQVHGEILLAQSRYEETAAALADYAPTFAEAKARADAAVNAYYPQAAAADEAYNDFLYFVGDPADEDEARQDWLDADARARATLEDYESAVADIRAASNAAAARIALAVDQSELNDSFWDNVSGFFDAVGQWFADVFGPILDAIMAELENVLQVLALLLSVVLVLALLSQLIVAGLLHLAGVDAGTEMLTRLLLAAVSPMVAVAWVFGHGTPTVELSGRRGPTEVGPDEKPFPFSSSLQDQDLIDGAGEQGLLGDKSGVIQVTVVVDEDGVTRYRVQIPSTQQWLSFEGDAPNDLDGNLWSKLTPGERSQLELAVETALLEAGYIPGSGSDVMLCGFSQGGIAAANLAADPDFTRRFDVQAVFTAGSPIGDVAIPDSVQVIALEHRNDPVPDLDLFVDNPVKPNWTTEDGGYSLDPEGNPVSELLVAGHNAQRYSETVKRFEGKPEYTALHPFFHGTETVYQFEARRG